MTRFLLALCLLLPLAWPCAAQDEDISMDDLVSSDGPQLREAAPVDLTMEGHSNKSLDELDGAERGALLAALNGLRDALVELDKRCAASCESKDPGADILVHEGNWMQVNNGWLLSEELRATLVGPTQSIYAVTDVGDLYWRIHALVTKIKGDWGKASDANRVKALVKVRYKLVPKALESLESARRRLHGLGALPSPYEVLRADDRRNLLQVMYRLRRSLGDYARLVEKAIADESVEAVTHKRPLIGANLWVVAEPFGTNFRESCQVLWAMHKVMDIECGGSRLRITARLLEDGLVSRLMTDWGKASLDKRMRVLLKLRDEVLPPLIAEFDAEYPVLKDSRK